MYILKDSQSENYFINPSYQGWDFTLETNEATRFATLEEAEEMKEEVESAIALTYWDYTDRPPYPEIVKL